MQVFLRVLPFVRRYPLLAFATLFCAVVGTLMVIVFPAVTQRIVDEVIGQRRPEMLWPLVGIGLAAFIAQNGLNICVADTKCPRQSMLGISCFHNEINYLELASIASDISLDPQWLI